MSEDRVADIVERLRERAAFDRTVYADRDDSAIVQAMHRRRLALARDLEEAAAEIERLRPPAVDAGLDAGTVEEMAQQFAELIECAERDLKMNRDEEPGGYWSLRTENCFVPAKRALAAYRSLTQGKQ